MANQKILLHSNFTLFCTCCGEVVALNILPTNRPNDLTIEFFLSGYVCPKCSNDSEFNVVRSEIKRLLKDY